MADKETLKILTDNLFQIQDRFEVRSLCLFGSTARGDNNADSDVDILVEMPPKIFLMSALKSFLEGLLHKSVDLIRRHPHLSQKFLSQIEKDGIYLF